MKTRAFGSSYTALCALTALLAACSLTDNRVAAPVMNPPPGTYGGSEIKITITCDDPDAAIFYTTNGADPSASSMVYMNDVMIRGDMTIKAIACVPGKADSQIAGGVYSSGWVTLPNSFNPINPFTTGAPLGIAVAANGMIYVTDSGGWVRRMDGISGKNLQAFDSGYTVSGISVGPAGTAYFTAFGAMAGHIVRIDDITSAALSVFGTYGVIPPSSGTDLGIFNQPYGVAVSAGGKFYVADSENNRIVCFDEMNFWSGWTSFGVWGQGTGQFSGPVGIAVGPDGRIYVADTGNNRIVRFDDMTGTATNNWTALGDPLSAVNGVGFFNQPRGIAVSSKNKIYVADTMNNRIVRMDGMNTAGWKEFQNDFSNPVTHPSGIAVDSQDFVYVADTDMSRIFRYYWP